MKNPTDLQPDMATLLDELAETWHRTIPVSEFMKIQPFSFVDATAKISDDAEPQQSHFCVFAPLKPNVNLHHTMFAGSIYTVMTLTGWGMLWIQQQLAGIEGDIVLADANIRYLAPITGDVVTKVYWPSTAFVEPRRQKLRIKLTVELYCGERVCAKFEGVYFSKMK